MLKNIVLWFFIYFYFCDGYQKSCHDQNESDKIDMYIVLSPMMTNKMIREIGIYWNYINIQNGDVVKLFKEDPNRPSHEELFQFEPNESRGFMKTGISAEFVPTTSLKFVQQCLKYYVSWIRDNTIQKTTCLSTHPNWMNLRKNTLGQLRIKDIFIPGTHESAAYTKFPGHPANPFEKFLITQDEDILSQLIYGVRYLDIHVGRYPESKTIFYASRGSIEMISLRKVINDVKLFLQNTNEIVIFDVQGFPIGFDSMENHHELIDYLEEQFNGHYLDRSKLYWRTTLEDIWSTGKRLIISYNIPQVLDLKSSVWRSVQQQWKDVRTLDALYQHLKEIENPNSEKIDETYSFVHPRAAMAILTAAIGKTIANSSKNSEALMKESLELTSLDVYSGPSGGIREMAENVNVNVTGFYNEGWQDTANIVVVDFIKSTGIIEIALKSNDRRTSTCI